MAVALRCVVRAAASGAVPLTPLTLHRLGLACFAEESMGPDEEAEDDEAVTAGGHHATRGPLFHSGQRPAAPPRPSPPSPP
eukprot:gene52556-62199_t